MLFDRRRTDQDFGREVDAHIELETDRLLAEGMSPEAAAAAARRAFGGAVRARERFYEARRVLWLDDARRDARYALRTLARSPGFAIAAVLTLALGIGANTAIFSVVHALVLRPLPYADADRFVRVVEEALSAPGETSTLRMAGLHKVELDMLRTQARSLSHLGVYVPTAVTLSGRSETVRVSGVRLSPAVLSMLGRAPLMGRLFEPSEERPGMDAVIVLGHGAWQRYFAGDRQVLGQHVSIDGTAYTVVGVMPEGFAFPDAEAQFWIPFVWPMQARLAVTARVADGWSIDAAREQVGTMLRQIRHDPRFRGLAAPPPPPPPPPGVGAALLAPMPESAIPPRPPRPAVPERAVVAPPLGAASAPGPPAVAATRISLVSIQEQLVAPVKPALMVLTAAVAFVLLIACVNVGNLLLARGAAREGELAIRAALGASRSRLARQALTESVLLAMAGGALGAVLAFGGVALLRALGTGLPRQSMGPSFGVPRLDEVAVNATALLFTVAVSIGAGLVFGLVPALMQSQARQADPLRAHPNAASGFSLFRHHRVRALLVVAEIAMALLLVVGAGLLLRSFVRLTDVDPGFDASGVLTFRVALPPGRAPAIFREELDARLQILPGSRASGYADQLPMGAIRGVMQLRMTADQPRVPPPPPAPGVSRMPEFPDLRLVSHRFLAVMRMRVVEGRALDERDGFGQPRALVINQALARSGLLGPRPIGRQIFGAGDAPWEIVGIVADVRQAGLDVDAGPQVFADFRQFPSTSAATWPLPYFAVRTDGNPAALVSSVRGLVRTLEPQATLDAVATLDQIVSNTVVRPRLYAVLLGIFAALALFLAVVGIYGVVAYSVSQRTREIGVRVALGATRTDVVTLVLGQSVPIVGAGLALGLAGALIVTQALEGLLFGVTPRDAATLAESTLLFALVALLAAALPARRAATIDPLIALRLE